VAALFVGLFVAFVALVVALVALVVALIVALVVAVTMTAGTLVVAVVGARLVVPSVAGALRTATNCDGGASDSK
jgi:hypothetical protein